MMRPDFSQIKTFEEFSKYYWYRAELIKLCRKLGLKSDGTKVELNKVIKAYFMGEKVLPDSTAKAKSPGISASSSSFPQTEPLSLHSSLILCNFAFNSTFRDFFSRQTGVKNFKFTADMAATVKKVRADKDTNFTLGDLLDIYYGRKTYVKYDDSALQWNKFVKDFCADPTTESLPQRLKAAASLWKIVRDSDMPKVYSHKLLEKYPLQ